MILLKTPKGHEGTSSWPWGIFRRRAATPSPKLYVGCLGHHRVAGLLQDSCTRQVGRFRVKSASMIWPRAAVWFSFEIARFEIAKPKAVDGGAFRRPGW
jgi:hypothetical protein